MSDHFELGGEDEMETTSCVVLWQPSHHPSGCCTLVVVEERPLPHDCKVLWVYSNTQ